jgi:hypothetical protein
MHSIIGRVAMIAAPLIAFELAVPAEAAKRHAQPAAGKCEERRDAVTVTGAPRPGTYLAKLSADGRWAQRVSEVYGVQWADISLVQTPPGVKYRCDYRTFAKRCDVTATPCRSGSSQ